MSPQRLQELQEEMNYLKTVREKEVAELIKEARSFGDLSENSEYDEAKNEQGKLYSRIAELDEILSNYVVIEEEDHDGDYVRLGSTVTIRELADMFLRLQGEGVHNINLVTGTHYTRQIAEALDMAKLTVPVAWNSSGYDSVESLRMLDGKVQIYMPDYKYSDPQLAKTYSAAADYPTVAAAAIAEMYRQTGPYQMDDEGILQRGVLVRHLILPARPTNTKGVIDTVSSLLPKGGFLFSLMSQYTPMPGLDDYPELQQRVTPALGDFCYRYMLKKGIEDGYYQDPESATDEMIPDFDLTGVK